MPAPRPFDPASLVARAPIELTQTYDVRDTMLYALGVGVGIDAVQGKGLNYVYEDRLRALPTMAVALAAPGFWYREPEYNIAWEKILHAEQSVEFHRALPVSGTVRAEFRIASIHDKGADKGALLTAERKLFESPSDALLATVRQTSFLRGNGGYGTVAREPLPAPVAIPSDRVCDLSLELTSRPEQALIYRLSGDYNPLHADPDIAVAAGFPQPILHGLCTYGMAGYAASQALCAGDASALKKLAVRFSSPVFPGETLRFDFWLAGVGRALLRAVVPIRNQTVLNNGLVEWRTVHAD